jgi:hypothetical protein
MINECRICKSSKLEVILSLGNQYLSEFRKDDLRPPAYPLDLVYCHECNQVQLGETVPGSLLYTDNYGYRSGINNSMRNHLSALYEEIKKVAPLAWPMVDIGSNDGTFLKNFPGYMSRIGFDLVSKFGSDYDGTGIVFVPEAFSKSFYLNRFPKAWIITAISMFYDLEDPVDFLGQLRDCLEQKGFIVIQQNYLYSMLKNVAFDNVCAEHIFYHSLGSMIKIANRCGLDIFNVSENDLNGGSFRVYLCHKGQRKIRKNVDKMLALEGMLYDRKTYDDFAYFVKLAKDGTYSFINKQVKKGKRVYVLGASTRGNTLLQYFELDNSLITKASERNPEKFGTCIASLEIPIVSEKEAREDNPDFMLVLPWFFKNEIIVRENEYLSNGGKLIFPLPKFKVVKK